MSEKILRDDGKEILPMLRDASVIQTVCNFIGCSQKDLLDTIRIRLHDHEKAPVTLRNQSSEKPILYGYYNFTIPKAANPTEFRTISAPFDALKNIQSKLLHTLRQQVPISMAAQGGELGTSPKKNALHHRQSSYLITTDVKSAYPSVSAQRIFKNLQGGLSRYVDISYPHLTEQQRGNFFHVLTTLISSNNKLPQGSPTSARMLNIVFANTDKEITKKVRGEQSPIHGAHYTRYIDDIALSFSEFNINKQFAEHAKKVIELLENITHRLGYVRTETPRSNLESIKTAVEEFIRTPYGISDSTSRASMRRYLVKIRELLLEIKSKDMKTYPDSIPYTKLIGELDGYKHDLNTRDESAAVRHLMLELRKIVNANGWTLNLDKERVWTPNSSVAKEITGVMIGKDGRVGISSKKMDSFISVARTAVLFPHRLNEKYLNPDGTVDAMKLAYVLQGVRNFIEDIKGRVPDEFEKRFVAAKAKYFPQFASHTRGTMMQSGGTM